MPTPRPLDEVAVRASFARFRFAAVAEGIALLVLVAIMVMRYVISGDPEGTWGRGRTLAAQS